MWYNFIGEDDDFGLTVSLEQYQKLEAKYQTLEDDYFRLDQECSYAIHENNQLEEWSEQQKSAYEILQVVNQELETKLRDAEQALNKSQHEYNCLADEHDQLQNEYDYEMAH